MIESIKNLNVNELESNRESNTGIKTNNNSIKSINEARTITRKAFTPDKKKFEFFCVFITSMFIFFSV